MRVSRRFIHWLEPLKPNCVQGINKRFEGGVLVGTQMRAWTPSVLSQAAVTTSSLEGRVLMVLMEVEFGEILLETFIVARAIEANIPTVEVISDVCKILLQLG